MGYRTIAEHREDTRRRKRLEIAESQDIAPLPSVVDPERRQRSIDSFKAFCENYFSEIFYLGWSKIHLDVIQKIESTVNDGSLFALAMPRGSGKTTLCKIALLWAVMTGRRRFGVLICSNALAANRHLDDLKIWIETNDALNGDFPEVCFPVRCLERISQRQRGQTLNGVPTRVDLKASTFVLPTVEGSLASGATICTAGMTGSSIRGLSKTDANGRVLRPDLCLIDDPQDRESADSPMQCKKRESIIKSDILGLSGPGKKLATLITTTVISEDDLAQRFLDRTRNPEFRGVRYQMLESLPTNQALWEEYRTIRENELRNDGDGSQATEFYRKHRAEMDLGAVATWEERFNSDEISAIQHAMNKRFLDLDAFESEYQNAPARQIENGTAFDPKHMEAHCNNRERGFIPMTSQFIAGFIDVHKALLYYGLVAFDADFNGVILDYGAFPKQARRYFKSNDASPILSDVYRGYTLEASIRAGLNDLVNSLFSHAYEREDGTEIFIKRIMIDANWGEQTGTVYDFVKESPYKSSLYPSHGKFFGASSIPMAEYKLKAPIVVGDHWYINPIDKRTGKKAQPHVIFDSNFWKSRLFNALSSPIGTPGKLVFNEEPDKHVLIAEHLAAEYAVPTTANGRTVNEWKQVKGRNDNHLLDCLVGSFVAASIEGATLPGTQKQRKTRRGSRLRDYYKGMTKEF